jgi:hypothetical protein
MFAFATAQNCDIISIEQHSHFTRIQDKNTVRECWFDTPQGSDVFLAVERYSGSNTVDNEAWFNISFGHTTINIHNAYVQVDKHLCAVPMQTKLEQAIWIWLHFEENKMTLQVAPANTAFFGHCFTVSNVEKHPDMHMVGSTSTGMEQVLRGITAKRPVLHNTGRAVVMRKTIHELERRLHLLEEKQEDMSVIISRSNKYHSDQHKQQHDLYRQSTKQRKDSEDVILKLHNNINIMDKHIRKTWPWTFGVCCVGICLSLIGYRLWALGVTQHKLVKFKL